jgi:hypothetical protein
LAKLRPRVFDIRANMIPRDIDRPIVGQCALRWMLLLRELGFAPPTFNNLEVGIIATPGGDQHPDGKLIGVPVTDFSCAIHFYPAELPADNKELMDLANECIKKALLMVQDEDSLSLPLIEAAAGTIEEQGEELLIPFRRLKRGDFTATVSRKVGGNFCESGALFLSVLNMSSGIETTRKLFDYCNYFDSRALIGKISKAGDVLTITAADTWSRGINKSPNTVCIDLNLFVEGQEFFLSDVSQIKKYLEDYDLPW